MKRILLSLLFVCSIVSCWAQRNGNAYEPTINWPYILDDFYPGTLVVGKDSVSKARMNIHLRSEGLYCIDDGGKVARIVFPNISCIIIYNKVYRYVDGKPMQQVYAEDGAMLMDYEYIDYDLMTPNYTEGMALYARATSETSVLANWNNNINYKSLHMKGEFNESYVEMRNNWFDGMKLPVKHNSYFVINGKPFRAIASDCNSQLDKNGQKKLKAFVKTKRLKWKNTADLIAILKYLKEIL